ncbi:MAG: hypothetical protein KKH94_10785 [Candidatus Omnitrophica bacterium]|nr:hypothetical protein [Candidatus Omnitrophota bacterium]
MNKEIQDFLSKVEKVVQIHPEYKMEAYHFVMGALHYTVNRLEKHRHVSGQELCFGIRDYALDQFGHLVQTVFEHWGIRETYDFGKIVYNLIESSLMSRTEEDSIDDFKNVYIFDEAFKEKIEYDI